LKEVVKSVLGPCPWTRIMPTGGVDATQESLAAWFKAGVACVGMGSKLITKDLVAKKDWQAITENVNRCAPGLRKRAADSFLAGMVFSPLYVSP